MSSLIENLNSIYTTKLQIKEVIGTQSDVFETYPELIAAAIGTSGGVDWDEVAAYGYIVPAGTVTLSSNGTVDVSTYANAYVSVPQSGGEGLDWDDVAQAGYIVPAGTKNITSNGTVDVSAYANVNVNVSGGGSGYYYPVHTISEINEFTIIDGNAPYMWMIDADEIDGETASVSTGVFSNKYWGYCYPAEFECMENPVLDIDGLWGLNMVSYTDLVKREFTYNALPDFNTYRGYTYSYQYVNPEYDPELGNDEYLTYEFNYGDDLLYSTQLEIVNLSQRERVAANEYFSGLYRVNDSDQVGLNGYYNETEMGEGNYYNKQALSIGCLNPTETSNITLTQFTTTYHGAASYTSGFDPYSLIGYNWNAVVDGNGWLVDIVSKGSAILVDSMWALDVNHQNPTYFTTSGNNFIRTMSFSDEHTDDYGNEFLQMELNGKEYDFNIGFGYIWDLFGVNPSDEDIPASGSNTFDVIFSNGEYSHIEAGEINNYYHDWSLSVTLSIPNNWYANAEGTGTMTVTWTFSGTRN